MPRARTGQLILRRSGYYARVRTLVEGEYVRVSKALGTFDEEEAKRKLARLLAASDPKAHDSMEETFAAACERVSAERTARGIAGTRNELGQLRLHAIPEIGAMLAHNVSTSDIQHVVKRAAQKGLSKASLVHLAKHVRAVLSETESSRAATSSVVVEIELSVSQWIALRVVSNVAKNSFVRSVRGARFPRGRSRWRQPDNEQKQLGEAQHEDAQKKDGLENERQT